MGVLIVFVLINASTGAAKEGTPAAKAKDAVTKEEKAEESTSKEEKSDDAALWAFELVYSEIALTPVSGLATEHWRLPSFRFSGLMPLEVSGYPLWVGGDVQLGGFLQLYGSSSAGSLFLGPYLRVRALVGTRWETPFVDVMPYVFVEGAGAIAMGTLIVGEKLLSRLQLPIGSEIGGGLWWDMSGFLLRLDIGAGFFDARFAVSLSGGVGIAF